MSVLRKQKDCTMKDVSCLAICQQYNRLLFGVDSADHVKKNCGNICDKNCKCEHLFFVIHIIINYP